MGLFGTKRPLSADEWEWQLASFKWLFAEFGGADEHRNDILVLPTVEFFPATDAKGDEFAREMFDIVKRCAGLEEWPTRLEKGLATQQHKAVQPGFGIHHPSGDALGTFEVETTGDGKHVAVVTYAADQADHPVSLVATLAHELAHCLMSTAATSPPGGWDIHELTTDLTAVFLGFGIFLGNSARTSRAFTEFDQQGWETRGQGYLSERALMTALAISETLAGRDPLAAAPHLKPYLAKDLKLAARYAASRDLAADMAAIDLADYGVAPMPDREAEAAPSLM